MGYSDSIPRRRVRYAGRRASLGDRERGRLLRLRQVGGGEVRTGVQGVGYYLHRNKNTDLFFTYVEHTSVHFIAVLYSVYCTLYR